jgi:subfamily B ATP-binding cassette protein MsbA
MTALLLLYEPLKRLTRLNNETQQGLSAARRIFGTLDTQPVIINNAHPIVLAKARGLITLEGVTFSYAPGRPALKDINLTINPGELLALVGPSGGGKTSLVNLVPRFHDPNIGRVLLDGLDLRDLDVKSLRDQIALVSQEVTLLDATVSHNIGYGRPGATEEDIQKAADAALALEFVEKLPLGFLENIGERGYSLSGGQRQRLAIARAILKDAPILILDEATSALDTESEKMVQKALENLMVNRTTLVIAHRLSTITKADRIIFLKNGQITEQGTHEELLALAGDYYRLYQLQFAFENTSDLGVTL